MIVQNAGLSKAKITVHVHLLLGRRPKLEVDAKSGIKNKEEQFEILLERLMCVSTSV